MGAPVWGVRRVLEDVDMHPQVRIQPEGVVLDDAQHQVVLAHEIGGEVKDVHHPAGQEQPEFHRAQ